MEPAQFAQNLMTDFITDSLRLPTLTNRQAKQAAITCCNATIKTIEEQCSIVAGHPLDFWKAVKDKLEAMPY